MKHWAIISSGALATVASVFLWWSNMSPVLELSPTENAVVVADSTKETSMQVSDVAVGTTTEVVDDIGTTSTVVEPQSTVVKTWPPNLSIDSLKSKEDAMIVKEYIASLSSLEVSNMIYAGDIFAELVDLLNIQMNFREIFNIVKPSDKILEDIGSTKERTTIGEGMGINVSLSKEDDMEIYVYDSAGRYTGTFPLVAYSDEARGILNEAKGVDLMRFVDSAIFNFSGPTQSTLFFKGKKGIVFPNLSVGIINEEPFSKFFFPVSESTRGSIVFTADADKITVGRLNIDFNGDGKTDVSIPITETFSKKDYENAFALMQEDVKLSSEDRAHAVSWEETFIEYLFKDEE